MEFKTIQGIAFNVDEVKSISKTEFAKRVKKSAEKKGVDPDVWYAEITGKPNKASTE